MEKANKEGWIRHRGGKCPVPKGTRVDVRYRSGDMSINQPALENGNPKELWAKTWEHDCTKADIMAYRLHTPATQQETKPMTAEQIRIQYIENLTSIAGLHKKNAALVDDLRKLGFDFHEAPKEPQEDMSDPKNWRVGDVLEHTSKKYTHVFTCGGKYPIIRKTNNGFRVRDNVSDVECDFDQLREEFKFHSRPTK